MRSKRGILRTARRPGALVALVVWTIAGLSPLVPSRRAEAKLDPLRVITTQLVKPNILLALDTSGSMAWRPDESTTVGGDCYNGSDCVTTPLYNTCTSGLPCDDANTCNDGSPCSSGSNGYCTDGSACLTGSLCGSGASATLCPSSTNTCKDGSACGATCAVSGSYCRVNGDCAPGRCLFRCNSGGTLCTTNADCPGSGNYCRTASSKRCTNNTSLRCTADSECTDSCTGPAACAASTGSTTCGLWCADKTPCSAPTKYCSSPSGAKSACAQECPDGGTCYSYSHCGSDTCPLLPQVYKGSSRMAIAKHVVSNIVDANANLVNFGFMTYNQDRYFPYVSSGAYTTTTETQCFGQNDLQDFGAWSSNAPASTFTRNGITYTIVATGGSGNSTYRTGTRGNRRTTSHDYCGLQCSFNNATWSFREACYTYQKRVQSGTLTYSYQSTYQGDRITIGGVNYSYYPFSPTDTGPIRGSGSSSVCDDATRNDGNVRVPLTMSEDATTRANTLSQIRAWLTPMKSGGLVPSGGTPIGCTLQYNYASSGDAPTSVGIDNDAYSYLHSVKNGDTLGACRKNFVILVTDGEPNGPGDSSGTCSASACSTASLSGCTCASVLAAKHLNADLGIKTYVVGFGSETRGSASLDNIARAGGSCRANGCAFQAGSEAALSDALQDAIFDAIRGDYSTAPPTVATSSGSAYGGDIALLASTEFPSWNGHLRASDIVHLDGSGNPTLLWDAGNLLQLRDWTTRKVFTSNPASGNAIVPLMASGAPNSAALATLGLGASQAEADSIIRWILGEGKPWKMGALFNVTGVTVSNNIELPFAGHDAYAAAHSTRPKMVYVGADDGLLHAFYLETGPNGEPAGSEAWAYLPPEMIPNLTSLYARGGQNADPATHIYGIAASPKVHDACTAPCNSASDWKTVLISGSGPGSTNYFALDITDPMATVPFSVLWRTAQLSNFTNMIGESWSVPAFAFVGSGATFQSGLLFGSGYTKGSNVGRTLFMINPITGANIGTPATFSPPGGMLTTYDLVSDLAVANDPSTLRAIAGYMVDLGGRLYRMAGATGAPTTLMDVGPNYPFYYSPAVSAMNGTDVVIAAVDKTFSDVDVNPASGSVATPKLWIVLDKNGVATAGTPIPFTNICKSACHLRSCAGCPKFDNTARPIASPVLLTNLDTSATSSLQVLLEIYQPVPNSCSIGSTSLVALDVTVDGVAGTVSLTQSEAKSIGAGLSAGIFIGAGGVLVSGQSGYGGNSSSVSVVAGAPATVSSSSGSTSFGARLMGISETDN